MFFLFTCLLFLVMIITNIVFIRRSDRVYKILVHDFFAAARSENNNSVKE